MLTAWHADKKQINRFSHQARRRMGRAADEWWLNITAVCSSEGRSSEAKGKVVKGGKNNAKKRWREKFRT